VIGALLLTAIAAGAGIVATYGFDPRAPGYARVATGMVIGLTTFAFAAFGLALVVGLSPLTLIAASLVTALLAIRLIDRKTRRILRDDVVGALASLGSLGRRPTRGDATTALYLSAIAMTLWLVADRNLFQTADGLYITNVGNLGDLPFHTAVTASFAYGANFPPQNPVASGVEFSYYYVVDFIAAVFVAAGTTLRDGMTLVTLILGACLLGIVHRWARDITGSRAVARLTPLLLVFSGGLGWFRLFEESRLNGNGLISAFQNSDIRFTIESEGLLRFQNAVTGYLVPQRGILLGMSIAVIVFTLFWQELGRDADAPAESGEPASADGDKVPGAPTRRRWPSDPRMTVAGVLTGILPMVHLHTFAVVLGTGLLLGVLFRQWRDGRWRRWLVYLAATAVVALPVLGWTARGNASAIGSYFGVQLGWELNGRDFLTFWLANTGLFIPILLVAFFWPGNKPLLSRRLVLYFVPFMAWFAVANVFRLAPWPWDNIKVLAYWWLGGTPVVAIVLVYLWQHGLGMRVLSILLTVVLVAAGALDVARSTIGPSVYQLWSTEAIAFAEAVRQRTPPNAIILADPTWDSPILLTGRPLFMGYAGWLFAHGLPYAEREQQAKAMFAGGADAVGLLRDAHVAYIEVGPLERTDVSPNDSFLSQFPVAVEVGGYRLYKVTSP
jgi:hypothetical protein